MDGEHSLYPQRKTTYPEIGTPELRRQIGKELKSAREFQEMSLEQVMAYTKINVRFLENIEEGKWNFLPPTYVKAFIRAYASSVGLQTEKLSNRLDELFQHVVTAAAIFKPYLTNDSEDRTQTPKTRGFLDWAERNLALLFYGLIGVIAAVLVIIYLLRPSESHMATAPEKSDTISSSGKEPLVNPPSDSVQISKAFLVDTTGANTAKTMSIELSFLDTCYVKLEHLDSTFYDQTLWPGNSVSLSMPFPIRLSLGNAPAVRLKIDGQAIPAFPGSRRVQVVNLGPGGIIG